MNAIDAKNASNQKNAKYFLITIDVEKAGLQVENLKPWIPFFLLGFA